MPSRDEQRGLARTLDREGQSAAGSTDAIDQSVLDEAQADPATVEGGREEAVLLPHPVGARSNPGAGHAMDAQAAAFGLDEQDRAIAQETGLGGQGKQYL